MRKILSLGCLFSVIPAFAATDVAAVGPSLPRLWIQFLMIFAILLVGITSRQISRVR